MMDDLRILVARLGWPSTAARWWTMQELSDRLGAPASKAATEAALLEFLSTRKLEAEVVEALFIFWMAAQAAARARAEAARQEALREAGLCT